MQGHNNITSERFEQVYQHGFSAEGDNRDHPNGELLDGAFFCISDDDAHYPKSFAPEYKEKLRSKTRLERLAIAGALIAAEIDRLKHIDKAEVLAVLESLRSINRQMSTPLK